MAGLFFLLIVILWLFVVYWLSKLAVRNLSKTRWRIPLRLLIFAVLLPSPLIDEIVGGRQFEHLCKENSTIQVDRATAVGKTVYLAEAPNVGIKGTWVRVVLQPRRFVDATTGEPVISYNSLTAGRGWFIRMLDIGEGDMPLTFKGWCKPGDQYTLDKLFDELKLTLVGQPKNNGGETK